jgi:hypothetical protein
MEEILMKKAIVQKAKELSLDLFAWQIRFLPMTQAEQKAQVEAQRKGLGLNDKKINTKIK